jgi:hypothetical protein
LEIGGAPDAKGRVPVANRRYGRLAIGATVAAALFLLGSSLQLVAQTDQPVYTDLLLNGWQDWGWATRNYSNHSPVHGGTNSIAVTANAWEGLQIYHPDMDSTSYGNLSFWIHGGTNGGQHLQIYGLLHLGTTNNFGMTPIALASPSANAWTQMIIPLASLGVANQPNFTGFVIQAVTTAQPTFYVDDITLQAGTNAPTTNVAVTLAVDAQRERHAISPLVYGTAFATSNQLADLNAPLNRSGGNAETRYNWQINAHNHAADWYFESLADSSATPGAAADDHVAQSKVGGAQAMITVPMIGWMPKLGTNRARLCSYATTNYGPQTGTDSQWFPVAGNGISVTNNTHITWNDPNDANFPTNSAFQRTYVQHLVSRWGPSTNGGVRYFIMDNEHTLWHSTHQDVHPVGTTMQEIRDKFFDYAAMTKSVDPAALVAAPEEWGWPGYFYSGYDNQWAGAHNDYNPAHYPDRGTNGGWDYMPWFLDQARQRAASTGQRLLDVFTLHIYPQGGEGGNDTSSATQILRNRSTRSLWDTNYVDASWINNIVMLIPRMKQWVAAYYPGTQIGVTEYNWGAESHINGATTQADILGIFGREGLDLATRWTTPDPSTPTYKAMQIYRNYDGNQSSFGDVNLNATGPNPDNVSVFAAQRTADGALTIMAINKQLSATATATVTISNFIPTGVAQVWQLTAANAITRQADQPFTSASFTNTLPAQSITLFVLPAGALPHLRAGTVTTGIFDFWLDGQASQRYVLLSSPDCVTWTPFQTNLLNTGSLHVTVGGTNAGRFFRAQWLP